MRRNFVGSALRTKISGRLYLTGTRSTNGERRGWRYSLKQKRCRAVQWGISHSCTCCVCCALMPGNRQRFPPAVASAAVTVLCRHPPFAVRLPAVSRSLYASHVVSRVRFRAFSSLHTVHIPFFIIYKTQC